MRCNRFRRIISDPPLPLRLNDEIDRKVFRALSDFGAREHQRPRRRVAFVSRARRLLRANVVGLGLKLDNIKSGGRWHERMPTGAQYVRDRWSVRRIEERSQLTSWLNLIECVTWEVISVYRNNNKTFLSLGKPVKRLELLGSNCAQKMLRDIFVKNEIDSELAPKNSWIERSVCNRRCSVCKFKVAGGAGIETFAQEHSILNRCSDESTTVSRGRDREAQQIAGHANPVDECVRGRACARVPISDPRWRQVGDNPWNSLGVRRDKFATIQPWNWNNSTVRLETVRCAVRDIMNDVAERCPRSFWRRCKWVAW